MMPVPLVSVRNCDRKPISPRVGIRNSRRTRPLPWFTIFVIVPRRMPTCAMTTPWNSSGDVDDEVLDRLHLPAVDLARHDLGARDLQLEALAPHHLDQDATAAARRARRPSSARATSVSSTRIDTLPSSSFASRSRMLRDVTYWPVAARHRRRVDAEDHRHGRFVDRDRRDRQALLGVGNRLADRDVLDAGQADDVAGRRPAAMSTRFRPSKAYSLVTRVSWTRPSSLQTATGSPILTRPLKTRPMAMRPR